jgi:hypothetical protein
MSASLTELLAVSALLTTAESVAASDNLPRTDQAALNGAVERVRLAFGIAALQQQHAVAVILAKRAPDRTGAGNATEGGEGKLPELKAICCPSTPSSLKGRAQ